MRDGPRGFSLLEALVALAIATTGVLSLAALAQHVVDTVARSRRHLSSAVLADAFVSARLDDPLSLTPADCLTGDTAGCAEGLDPMGRATTSTPAFIRRWRVVAVAAAPRPSWSLSVCVVPVDRRHASGVAPGACVSRVVTAVAP